MILFVNTFRLAAPAEEFERAFAETADFLCAQHGFVSHRLVRSTTDPARYLNIAHWESETALRAATELPQFPRHATRLRELASTDPQFFRSVQERHA